MYFSAITFISILPLVVGLYWLLWTKRNRNIFLIVFSSIFVAYNGASHFIVLICIVIGSTAVVKLSEIYLEKRKAILSLGVIFLLLILVYYKYSAWLVSVFGISVESKWMPQNQPLGISYYIFATIGIMLQLTRENTGIYSHKLPQMLLFFPALLSGPIVRLQAWSSQISGHKKGRIGRNVTIGTQLFLVGLFKKIIVSDSIATSIAPIWANPSDYGAGAIAFAIFGFYLQLYADFSGYTDMARGVARMMGFHLPINFKGPYLSATPMEFWSRWHMSLTGWIRDYLFTPISILVWRRVRSPRLVPAVSFTLVVALMALVGLWHGASAQFIVFGTFHGVLIGIWYAVVGTGKRLFGWRKIVSALLFQFTLIISLLLFRADSFESAGGMLNGLTRTEGIYSMNDGVLGLIIVSLIVFAMQYFEISSRCNRLGRRFVRLRSNIGMFPIFVFLILLVAYMKGITLEGVWISPSDPFFNAGQEKFIYFKF